MRLNEILGTEFPFIQGGMANIATGAFAAAVSNAGAWASLPRAACRRRAAQADRHLQAAD